MTRRSSHVVVVASQDVPPDVEAVLVAAIDSRRIVTFVLEGRARVAEPHDLGIINGQAKLFFYQVGGESRSQPPTGWRWAELAKIADLDLTDRPFPGPRPIPSNRHHNWDRLIASVSRPVRPRLTVINGGLR